MKRGLSLFIASSLPFLAEGSWEVGGDFLYWKTYQDNLVFGAHVQNITPGVAQTIASEPLFPNFKADPGFRIFANYLCSEDLFHIGGIFTRIATEGKNSNHTSNSDITQEFIVANSQSFPIFNALNQSQFSNIDSLWNSEVNYFDLDCAYVIALCNRFDIVPHMGLRGMWLRQRLALDGISPSGGGGVFSSNFYESYDGYGLEGGLNASLLLGCGFRLKGQLGGSLLYARIAIDETLDFIPNTSQPIFIRAQEKIYHLSPSIDGFLGVQYLGNCGCCLYDLHVGWEQHYIMNVNGFTIFNFTDLNLQGLTVGGSIAF